MNIYIYIYMCVYMLGSMLADVWVGSNHKVQRGGDRPQFSQRGALLDAWASSGMGHGSLGSRIGIHRKTIGRWWFHRI